MLTKSIHFDAVIDRDLKNLLDSFHLLDPIKNSDLLCPSCDRVITLENVGAIGVTENGLTIYCDNLSCIGGELNK